MRSAASFNSFITSGSRGWAKYYADHGDLFMRITNLKRDKIRPDLSDCQYVALPSGEREGLRTGLRQGDILISITADIGIIGYVDESIQTPAYINQHIACLRLPEDQLSSKFVAYYLASAEPQRRFIEMTDVGAKTGMNLATVGKLKFPCPPIEEQHAIAEALSDADALIEGLERLIAKKRLIKQGAMQDLLTAKRRLPGFSGEWVERKFGEIARIRNQKVQTFGDARAEKCIELEQIEGETGRLRFWTSASDRKTSKYLFAPGDVLFGRLRPYLRKYFLAASEGVCSTEVWPFMGIGVTSSYLYHIVQSDLFVAAASESYGTHMPRADWGKLLNFELTIPEDSDEQNAIGSVLLEMDAEIQTLETLLDKARQVKEGMMQNLLTGRIRLV